MIDMSLLLKTWGFLKNILKPRPSGTNNQDLNGFQENNGTIIINSGSINTHYHTSTEITDPEYHCKIVNGEKICPQCYPIKISTLIKRCMGGIPYLHCNECEKKLYPQ